MKIAILGPAAPKEFFQSLGVSADGLPPGLGGSPVNELVRALLMLGHKVHLITTSPDIAETQRFDSENLHVSVVPLRSKVRHRALDMFRKEIFALRSELQRIPVDVVHAHWTYEFALAVDSANPTLITAHDAPVTILRLMPNAYRLIRLLMACRVLIKTRNLSAVSPYLSSQLRKQMFFKKPICVIPNIVPELPYVLAKRSDGLVVIDIATSAALKNISALIKAMAVVRDAVPGAELRLIGPGLDINGPIAFQSSHEGLDTGVSFLGIRGRLDIASHLAEATVFCHPSLEEAQPMSVLEAMAAKLPIIGGIESGGMSWTLGGGDAGVLVDVKNPEAIANAILELHYDNARALDYVRNGETLIHSRFSSMAVGEAYIAEYIRIIAEYSMRNRKGTNK